MDLLTTRGLCAGYGRALALHDVDLTVQAGEICTILGSNGAGKTTLLRTLIGIHSASAGRIELDGKDITSTGPRDRVKAGIALSPEGRHLFKHLTVSENLSLGGRVLPTADDVRVEQERVYELFPRLHERRDQKAGSLSGGEQQMCAIGRALMARPRLLMLDEPSLGLAPRVVTLVLDTIREINAAGTSVLLVEQNAAAALGVASRAYVLHLGRVVLEGAAEELRDHPQVREAYLGGA